MSPPLQSHLFRPLPDTSSIRDHAPSLFTGEVHHVFSWSGSATDGDAMFSTSLCFETGFGSHGIRIRPSESLPSPFNYSECSQKWRTGDRITLWTHNERRVPVPLGASYPERSSDRILGRAENRPLDPKYLAATTRHHSSVTDPHIPGPNEVARDFTNSNQLG